MRHALHYGMISAGLALLLLLSVRPASDVAAQISSVTGADSAATESIGTFNGVPFQRTRGIIHGIVASGEHVVGLDGLPKDAAGMYEYTSEFEIIAPTNGSADTIVVEAENRGSPLLLAKLNDFAASGPPSRASYPSAFGNAFLFNNGIAYARVQWQTGIGK